MAFTVNPFSWKAFNLSLRNKGFDEAIREWQKQVSDFCTQVQTLFTQAGLASSLKFVNASFVNVATNQTLNCASAVSVMAYLSVNTVTAVTLTLTNLSVGVPVVVVYSNGSAGAPTFKLAASTPTSVSYSVTGIGVGGPSINLTATGTSPASGNSVAFSANSTINSGTPALLGAFVS